jgi:cbb3-type cytochrome oxidase subunit 3
MPGFPFWGLFLVFGLIVVAYVVWMFWVERREPDE